MFTIAMIPARMGSQRLKHKNLREIAGLSLIVRAIRKCKDAGVFDEIWVNSEHDQFGDIARHENVFFHKRPDVLADNQATSEQFVREFCEQHVCDYLFQVHSIAPLLTAGEVQAFVCWMRKNDYDVGLSAVPEQIECAMNGRPVNFSFTVKTNSQELAPVQRITWSITGWRRDSFLQAAQKGVCATYAGRIGIFPVNRMAGHVVKTEADLQIAEALLPVVEKLDSKREIL